MAQEIFGLPFGPRVGQLENSKNYRLLRFEPWAVASGHLTQLWQMCENLPVADVLPIKSVIFDSYLELPEATHGYTFFFGHEWGWIKI